MPHSKDLEGKSAEPRRILVTGATGQQGGALARTLLRRGHHVRALSRKPEGPAAGELKRLGAEVVAGDLGDRAAVEHAAKGVDAAFLVATPFEQGPAAETRLGVNAVDAFRAAGVPYIVYSSVSDADRKTGIPHFDSKAAIEAHLRDAKTPHAIVAPVFFMENLLAPWIAQGMAKGVLATGVLPELKLQVVSLPEIAEFSTLALEHPDTFRGKRVNLASDAPTLPEIARQISELTGRALQYQAIPLDLVRKQSEDMASMYDWFNRVGYSADIPALRRDYPQVHWRTFPEWSASQDWARALAPPAKA